MASNDKKPKTSAAAPKKEAPAESKSAVAADPSAAESSEAAVASSYSRGEGQKPVSKAYKENWNAIYGKKKKKKR